MSMETPEFHIFSVLPDPEEQWLCYKCGRSVAPENSVVQLDFLLGVWRDWQKNDCHLLPTENCIGSPSRYQYLEGFPRDPRPEYVYYPEVEELYRRAYQVLQEDCNTSRERETAS